MKKSLEFALQEVESWLDYKKIKQKKRESNREQEELLVDAISDGSLQLQDDFYFKYELAFPLQSDEGEVVLSEMEFKPRLQVFEIKSKMKGVKSTDVDGRIIAYIMASTGLNSGLIRKLDTEDFNVAQAIILYFL